MFINCVYIYIYKDFICVYNWKLFTHKFLGILLLYNHCTNLDLTQIKSSISSNASIAKRPDQFCTQLSDTKRIKQFNKIRQSSSPQTPMLGLTPENLTHGRLDHHVHFQVKEKI